MAEYIYTNLPQFVKVNSRAEFSSSVVSSGAALLFSENGSSLTAKLPDGSFVEVGGSGTDVSSTTAEASDVLSGKLFYTSGGTMTSGTIPTVSATVSGAVVTVPSGYIASSQTITVSGGIDISSTTAEAGDVLSGKIFYTSGGTQTSGTIPSISSATITPATSNQVISSGCYLAGDQTILGDPNLVGSNIASGVSIFGVSGTFSGAVVQTDYYKCASVNSGGSTWTGYKAVLSGGSYSFASSVTSNLTYGSAFTPQAGKIYADGALVMAQLYEGVPVGDILDASLASNTPEVGNEIVNYDGNAPSYNQTVNGITGVYTNYAAMKSAITSMPTEWTIAIWAKVPSSETGGIMSIGGDDGGHAFLMTMESSTVKIDHASTYVCSASNTGLRGSWHHYAATYASDGTNKLFIDGVQVATASSTIESITDQTVYMNGFRGQGVQTANYAMSNLYLSHAKVFGRVLTASEIAALAAEITPAT